MGASASVDNTCIPDSVIPDLIAYGLMLLEWICVIITSIRSFSQLKSSNDNWSSLPWSTKFSMWLNDVWRRKDCYLEMFPHIFDQATDIGVIITFYDVAKLQQHDSNICSNLNMNAIFWISIMIIVMYRIISSIQIYVYTHNIRQLIFQLLDIEFIHALMVNYKSKQNNDNVNAPCQPQKWISMMEATFESVPQSIVQFVYLILSGLLFTSFGVVHISFIWSIITIVLRNVDEDERIFQNAMSIRLKARLIQDDIPSSSWKSPPSKWFILFPLRLFDISCRVFILGVCYIYLQWFIFLPLNLIEIIILIIIAIKTKRYDRLNHFIRCELNIKFIISRLLTNIFWSILYLTLSGTNPSAADVVEVILIFVFPTLFILIIFFFIYRKIIWYNKMNIKYFNKIEMFHSSRSIDHLISSHHWIDIYDLILFGFNTNPNELIQKHPNILNEVSEDFETGEIFLKYLMNGLDLNINKFKEIWLGTIQAIENKHNQIKKGIITKIFNLKNNKKEKEKNDKDDVEFNKMINFLETLLSNPVCFDNADILLNAITSHNERTVLHILVIKKRGNYKQFLDEIIKHKAIDPNICDKFNETALHIATNCREDNESIDVTKSLLKSNNIEINVFNKSLNNETPLHYSIKHESFTLCDIFLKHNSIDINQLTQTGDTYLLYAAQKENEDIALTVINNDVICDINAQNNTLGDTALHVSISKPRLFTTLIEKFNDTILVNVHNKNGIVCLMNAAEYSDNNICLDLLLKHNKLEINAADNNGNSTLHRIVLKDNILNNFRKIISHNNININLRNNIGVGGYSALHLAYFDEIYNDYTMYNKMKLLLNHSDININLQTLNNGNTALHGAINIFKYELCQNRKNKLILLLSQPNINVNISNNNNETAMIISINQLNIAHNELKEAERMLDVLKSQLIQLQQIYQQKQSKYQKEKDNYDNEMTQYEQERREFQDQLNAYNNGDISNYPSSPSKPSASAMNSAKREMESAKRNRDNKQREVNKQKDKVEKCKETVRAAAEIKNILEQYS